MSAGGCVPENLRCRRIAAPSSTVVLFFGWQLRAQRLGDYQRRLSVVSHKSARSHFISGAIITLGDYHQLPIMVLYQSWYTNDQLPMIWIIITNDIS